MSELPDHISYNSARFQKSALKLHDCPEDTGVEVAFAGRSNAGKSTALNAITDNSNLARTSKTPGRTQLINFFSLHVPERRLVDLPGYGFAKVAKHLQQDWQQHLAKYLQARESLAGLFIISDIRQPMREFDQQIMQWCLAAQLPVHILLSKADKLAYGKAKTALMQVARELPSGAPVTVQLFSGVKKSGVDEARAKLDEWLLGGGSGSTLVVE